MLLDANLLLYAVDERSPHHARCAAWLTDVLNGTRRVGLPEQTLQAFVRIVTHPRVTDRPLSPAAAWTHVQSWLDAPTAWVPPTGDRTVAVLGELVHRHGVTGNLVPDAALAALAIEHGLVLCSADTDFARFAELRWHNPLAA